MRFPFGHLLAPTVAALTLSFGAGCSGTVVPVEPAEAETASAPLALVVVERTTSANDDARAEAVARFVRMRAGAVDEDALRMVGAAVNLPVVGSCAALSTLGRGNQTARAVELVDVGAVTLETNGITTALPARRLPDVADLVSGVVYARAADPEAMPSRGRYALKIAGTATSAPFAMEGFAPGEPAELRVAGQDVHAGPIALARSGSTELSWEAGSADDLVYVDVLGADGAAGNVRCLVQDSGHAVLPAAAFGAIEEGSLAVHRLHKEPLRLKGTEAGELRFDFARTVSFTRR